MNQDLTQSSLTGGNTSTTGFATGTTCPKTGSYKSSTKYMDTIIVMVKGAAFPTGTDGRKTTWYSLSSADSNKSSFDSVKVAAGTI